ncbi:hypothetical protein LIQ52_05400 [Mitsuokella jalaludinii]|uniref:hypothetical protein n=1 Tax=Mitsuokella jalaludinii TaxID=187979 RepID=UPI001D035DD6|nr:hypothetical protein [Mitsuokella jalaludinii]MCB5724764.1 hypothetical protein [Mitsuokella jalaludinii]
MQNKKSFLLALLACFALAWPGISSASPAQAQQTVTMSRTDLTELQENNRKQQIALMQSAEALKKAKDALQTSAQALKQTREELTQSKVETQNLKQALTASQSETALLLSDLEKQKQETQTLQQQLQTLQQQSQAAGNSLAEAQKYLDDTRAEFLKNEKAHEKTERGLKNRIKAWQAVAAILCGVAITR